MANFAPEKGERFPYEGIQDKSDSIRLLTLLPGPPDEQIACHLDVVSLKSRPRYETLSYAWGSQDRKDTILLNDKNFPVTTNLHAALLYLRLLDRPLYLWIDAICIDQDNLPERSAQVAKMRDIYRSSSRVYVWLGQQNSLSEGPQLAGENVTGLARVDSGVGGNMMQETWTSVDGSYAECRIDIQPKAANPFGLVEHFARDKHMFDLPGFQYPEEGRVSVLDPNPFLDMHEFLDKSWWCRVWCVQEILLAPDALLMYGPWRIRWDYVKQSSVLHRRHVMSCCSETQMHLPNSFWKFRDDDIVERSKGATLDTPRYQDLDALLRLYAHRNCQDPRDKIYGLLGLADMSRYPEIIPDYSKDPGSVFYDATLAIIHDNLKSLRFLTGIRGTRSLKREQPSWVRDFSHTHDIATTWVERHRLERYDLLYKAASNSAADLTIKENKLGLRGTKVATIEQIGAVRTQINVNDSVPVIESWLRLAGLPVPIISEEINKPRQRQFWRTITADAALAFTDESDYVWSRASEKSMDTYLESISNFLNPESNEYTACGRFKPSLSKIILVATLQKAFFTTRDGFMGLAYPNAEPGDEIWVLEGGNMPFVLRPTKQNNASAREYHLVGDCYLDGFMDGQACQRFPSGVTDVVLM